MTIYFLQVLMPNKVYNGQKLTRLVSKKMAETANNTILSVPVMTSLKDKMLINTTIAKRIILSRLPMFFFISKNFARSYSFLNYSAVIKVTNDISS